MGEKNNPAAQLNFSVGHFPSPEPFAHPGKCFPPTGHGVVLSFGVQQHLYRHHLQGGMKEQFHCMGVWSFLGCKWCHNASSTFVFTCGRGRMVLSQSGGSGQMLCVGSREAADWEAGWSVGKERFSHHPAFQAFEALSVPGWASVAALLSEKILVAGATRLLKHFWGTGV